MTAKTITQAIDRVRRRFMILKRRLIDSFPLMRKTTARALAFDERLRIMRDYETVAREDNRVLDRLVARLSDIKLVNDWEQCRYRIQVDISPELFRGGYVDEQLRVAERIAGQVRRQIANAKFVERCP